MTARPQESISLQDLLSKLEELAIAYQVAKIQWPVYDKFFNYFSAQDFITVASKVVRKTEIFLIKRPPLVKSAIEKQEILTRFHDDPLFGGHTGFKRMYAKLRTQFSWPGMHKETAKYVKNCHSCKMNKPGIRTKQELTHTKTPIRPLDLVQVDTIGPLQKSLNGFKYAVTLIDELTKFLVIIPVTDKSAKTVARAIFDQFILKYGPMKSLKSDLGTEYVNETMKEICQLLKIEHKTSTAYHHETMGAIERSHRILNEYLRSYLKGNLAEWDIHANYFCFCYNSTHNATSNHMYSPYKLLYGRQMNMPNNIFKDKVDPIYNVDNYAHELKYRLQRSHVETKALIEKLKIRNKILYDKSANEIHFRVGGKIKIRKEPNEKFNSLYSGPFEILSTVRSLH